jgi:hypothetical protein
LACGVKRQSSPPSTSAAFRAVGTPLTVNAAPVAAKASAAVGTTSPNACCHWIAPCGISAVPPGSIQMPAARSPSEE